MFQIEIHQWHFRWSWPAHNTIGHATLIYSFYVYQTNNLKQTYLLLVNCIDFRKCAFDWQRHEFLELAFAKQAYTYKYRKTEKEKQEEKSQKIRNASLAKFYLQIFIFLSLNYVSGVPLGSRKTRWLAVSLNCLHCGSHIFDKIGVELEPLRVT